MRQACFAAGCFWGTQAYFEREFKEKISNVRVGFTGGHVHPVDYRDVVRGNTGHAEAVLFDYNPKEVDYASLCHFFFRMHNPTTKNRQGNDVGSQYRSAIFVFDEAQRGTAEHVMRQWNGENRSLLAKIEEKFGAGQRIATTVESAGEWHNAGEEHQEYLARNPGGYCNHKIYIQKTDVEEELEAKHTVSRSEL